MDDTISRKAVTDAIEKCHKRCCREDATGDEWIHYETTLNEVESIPPAQPAPDNNGDLWITVPDIDKVTCVYVQESKSKFCKIFYEERI